MGFPAKFVLGDEDNMSSSNFALSTLYSVYHLDLKRCSSCSGDRRFIQHEGVKLVLNVAATDYLEVKKRNALAELGNH